MYKIYFAKFWYFCNFDLFHNIFIPIYHNVYHGPFIAVLCTSVIYVQLLSKHLLIKIVIWASPAHPQLLMVGMCLYQFSAYLRPYFLVYSEGYFVMATSALFLCHWSAATDNVFCTFSSFPHIRWSSCFISLMKFVKLCTVQIISSVSFFENLFLNHLHDSGSNKTWISWKNTLCKVLFLFHASDFLHRFSLCNLPNFLSPQWPFHSPQHPFLASLSIHTNTCIHNSQ